MGTETTGGGTKQDLTQTGVEYAAAGIGISIEELPNRSTRACDTLPTLLHNRVVVLPQSTQLRHKRVLPLHLAGEPTHSFSTCFNCTERTRTLFYMVSFRVGDRPLDAVTAGQARPVFPHSNELPAEGEVATQRAN